jgi:hypothetical protein
LPASGYESARAEGVILSFKKSSSGQFNSIERNLSIHDDASLESELTQQYKNAAGDDSSLSRSIDAGGRTYCAGDKADRSGGYISSRHSKVRMIEEVVSTDPKLEGCTFGDRDFFGQLTGQSEEAWPSKAVWSNVAEISLLSTCCKLCGGKAGGRDGRGRAASVGQVGIKKIRQNCPAKSRREIARDLTVCHRERASTVKIELAPECPVTQGRLKPTIVMLWSHPEQVSGKVMTCVEACGSISRPKIVRVIHELCGRGARWRIDLKRMAPRVEGLRLKSIAEGVAELGDEPVVIGVTRGENLAHGRET